MTVIDGLTCITRKGQFKVGDLAVYVPIEAMLPMDRSPFKELGLKTDRAVYRVKAIKLRGTYSEGLLIPLNTGVVGHNMASEWGITKYEEPEPAFSVNGTKGAQQDRDLDWAPKYDLDNFLKNRWVIPEGTDVVVTEKIHGCNGRFTYGPDHLGETRLLVGSHNQWKRPLYTEPKFWRQVKKMVNRFTTSLGAGARFAEEQPVNNDVWWTVAKRLDLAAKLKRYPRLVFYGEVYGSVQDLKYSVPTNERVRLKIFDVYDANARRWLNTDEVHTLCQALELEMVPVLFTGRYVQEIVDPLRHGLSIVDGVTMREGFVIRPRQPGGVDKLAYKYVSEEYKLRKAGSEFH
jgi:RNA ligase (TIGR02306 family)